jgi:hypothetical protein
MPKCKYLDCCSNPVAAARVRLALWRGRGIKPPQRIRAIAKLSDDITETIAVGTVAMYNRSNRDLGTDMHTPTLNLFLPHPAGGTARGTVLFSVVTTTQGGEWS